MSLDASAGFVVARTKTRSVRLQADVLNLTNRLNVIDFAGLFSGTALAPPRSVGVRIKPSSGRPLKNDGLNVVRLHHAECTNRRFAFSVLQCDGTDAF